MGLDGAEAILTLRAVISDGDVLPGPRATRVAFLAPAAVGCQPVALARPRLSGPEASMAGYFVANYTITNPAGYQEYLAAVGPVLAAHGAETVVVDRGCALLEGSAGQVTVVLRFATKEAATAWYESPEYQAIKHLRTNNSEGTAVIAEGR